VHRPAVSGAPRLAFSVPRVPALRRGRGSTPTHDAIDPAAANASVNPSAQGTAELAVVRFPGSNCDDDARFALERAAGASVRFVWHTETDLAGVRGVLIPGGFSYGDYLRSGALAAQSPVMAAVTAFAARGGPVLGVCNGFQVLTETGLLPGALARNAGLAFVCKTVTVRVERDDLPLLDGLHRGQLLRLPVAHHDGRFVADAATLDALEAADRIALRYLPAEAPDGNPNGSDRDVAGVLNAEGNVLGLMPHPERAAEPLMGGVDGMPLLRAFARAAGVAA
jgi:phosphoribosylformylglycinamidine synthase subunit PurQ / glutaminase